MLKNCQNIFCPKNFYPKLFVGFFGPNFFVQKILSENYFIQNFCPIFSQIFVRIFSSENFLSEFFLSENFLYEIDIPKIVTSCRISC
jgi:hypothetical protein